MRKHLHTTLWFLATATLLATSGCVTNQQIFDFARTEFARLVADALGRVFQVFVQATA